jgi:hypothetical protein
MPYSLRPGNQLKRPYRYIIESDDELDDDDEPSSKVPKRPSPGPAGAFGHFGPSLTSLSSAAPQPPRSQLSHHPHPNALDATKPPTTSIPPRKFSRLRRQNTRNTEAQDAQNDNMVSSTRGRGRPAESSLAKAAQPIYSNLTPTASPAAFPSLSLDQPATMPAQPDYSYGAHGVKRRMTAHQYSNKAELQKSERQVDLMYANKKFPAEVGADQKAWYADLKKRLSADSSSTKVCYQVYAT